MSFSEIADLANVLTAIGMIVSLGFVAYELRKTSDQGRMANWHSVLNALREHKRRSDDPAVADVLFRGRQDYDALAGGEKIMFGYWMEEWIQAQEGLMIFRQASAHSPETLVRAARGNLRAMFLHPGCRVWWRESGLAGRWPPALVAEVEASISDTQSGPV